ncbi:Aldo/keto reductase [Clavulina sp. PMI_390]|nr:Aldo/keto reductase [Clavulina sp. PMI_390]
MTLPTVPFGSGDAPVGVIGQGLMNMTMKSQPLDDEVCFNAIKASLDFSGPVITESNSSSAGEFYGVISPMDGLHLLKRFLTNTPSMLIVRCSAARHSIYLCSWPTHETKRTLPRSVAHIQKLIGSNKKLDHFECGRMDGETSIETVAGALKELVDERQIGLSEVNANTTRRAAKVAPIASIETEVAPWAYADDVEEVAAEVGVTVMAYSPLGRGFLTGAISPETLAKDDRRRHFPRFGEEAMVQNQKIVDGITTLAKKKGMSNAQLCLAWVHSLGSYPSIRRSSLCCFRTIYSSHLTRPPDAILLSVW